MNWINIEGKIINLDNFDNICVGVESEFIDSFDLVKYNNEFYKILKYTDCRIFKIISQKNYVELKQGTELYNIVLDKTPSEMHNVCNYILSLDFYKNGKCYYSFYSKKFYDSFDYQTFTYIDVSKECEYDNYYNKLSNLVREITKYKEIELN